MALIIADILNPSSSATGHRVWQLRDAAAAETTSNDPTGLSPTERTRLQRRLTSASASSFCEPCRWAGYDPGHALASWRCPSGATQGELIEFRQNVLLGFRMPKGSSYNCWTPTRYCGHPHVDGCKAEHSRDVVKSMTRLMYYNEDARVRASALLKARFGVDFPLLQRPDPTSARLPPSWTQPRSWGDCSGTPHFVIGAILLLLDS